MSIKLGSLFDGSGGFPLAGAISGIEPVWAAEVEPYPISSDETPRQRDRGAWRQGAAGGRNHIRLAMSGLECGRQARWHPRRSTI